MKSHFTSVSLLIVFFILLDIFLKNCNGFNLWRIYTYRPMTSLLNTQPDSKVFTASDAMKWLKNYGYLNCKKTTKFEKFLQKTPPKGLQEKKKSSRSSIGLLGGTKFYSMFQFARGKAKSNISYLLFPKSFNVSTINEINDPPLINTINYNSKNDKKFMKNLPFDKKMIISSSLATKDANDLLPDSFKQTCTQSEIDNGLKLFQTIYQLPITGKFDTLTIEAMNKARCGNRDNEKQKPPKNARIKAQTTHIPPGRFRRSNNVEQNAVESLFARKRLSIQEDELPLTNEWEERERFLNTYDKQNSLNLNDAVSSSSTSASSIEADSFPAFFYTFLYNVISAKLSKFFSQTFSFSVRRSTKTFTTNFASRRKRSIVVNAKDVDLMFARKIITWRLVTDGYSSAIPIPLQRATIALAFRMWSESTPLLFREDNYGDINDIDIQLAFATGKHFGCPSDFDGYGGQIAHSWHGGNIHFDDTTPFRSQDPLGVSLLKVAVHEIGHVLGLVHTQSKFSIMHAIYTNFKPSKSFELSNSDKAEIQKIYGKCKGRFDTVFDWVHKRSNNRYTFNTYFFRSNRFWLYHNGHRRPRHGDPHFVSTHWQGLPDKIDAFAHVWMQNYNHAYFFSGKYVFDYNDGERSRQLIRNVFNTHHTGFHRIPDYVDSVYFDMRDNNLYFFKHDLVYIYIYNTTLQRKGCCLKIRRIVDQFPTSQIAKTKDPVLSTDIDASFYSYSHQQFFFLSGEDVWVNDGYVSPVKFLSKNSSKLFNDSELKNDKIFNSIRYLGKWYDLYWNNICDVFSG